MKNQTGQRNKPILINSNNSKEKRKDEYVPKCFSPLPKNSSQININSTKNRERDLINTSPRSRKKTFKESSKNELKPSTNELKMNDVGNKVNEFRYCSSSDQREKKNVSKNNSQNSSANTSNRNKVNLETPQRANK